MKAYFFFIFTLVTLTNCAQLPLSIERADSGHIRGEDAADPNSRGISLNKWINDEISKGSLVTQVSSKDKRVKIIQPASELIDEFTMWLDMIDKAA